MGDPKNSPILRISDTPVDIGTRELSLFGPRMGFGRCRCNPSCPPRRGNKHRYHQFPQGGPITVEKAVNIPLGVDDVSLTNEVRNHAPGSKEQQLAKKQLRAMTPGGVVFPFRSNATVQEFNGIIPLDCDGTKDPSIRDRLIADPCVAHIKRSPGGRGYHVWPVVDPLPTADTYLDQQQQVLNHFQSLYGDSFEKIDDLKDQARIHFVNTDPDAYRNLAPKPLIAKPRPARTYPGAYGRQTESTKRSPRDGAAHQKTATPQDQAWCTETRRKLKAALQDIPLPQGSYPDWVAVGYGLVGVGLECRAKHGLDLDVRTLFVEWTRAMAYPGSSKPSKADHFYSECEATYDVNRPRRGSLASVLTIAQRVGGGRTQSGNATKDPGKTRSESEGKNAAPEDELDTPPYLVSGKNPWGLREALAHIGFEFRYNTRSLRFEIRPTKTSAFRWGALAPPQPNGWITIIDHVAATLRAIIARDCCYKDSTSRTLKLRLSKDLWQEWQLVLGSETYGDPWMEYLLNLPDWDGEDRFARLFPEAYGVVPSEGYSGEYLKHAARLLFMPIVGRTLKPGAEASTITVIIGPEGTGKSYGLELRFPPEWVMTWCQTRASFRWDAQTTVERMSGCVSGEIAEMAGLTRVETEDVKNFVENKIEKGVRLSYRRDPEDFPRSWHLVGTSNRLQEGLLPDVDGLRRFWPVDVGDSDYEKVIAWYEENRGQLWAQTLAECRGAPDSIDPWRNPKALREEVKAEVDRHRKVPSGLETIVDLIEDLDIGEEGWPMARMLWEIEAFGPMAHEEHPRGETLASVAARISAGNGMAMVQKLGSVLGQRGWTKSQKRLSGKRRWVWIRPPSGTGDLGSTDNSS